MLIEADKRGSKNSLALAYSARNRNSFMFPQTYTPRHDEHGGSFASTAWITLYVVDSHSKTGAPLFGCTVFTNFSRAEGLTSLCVGDLLTTTSR